jgi:hypothetical protein
VSTSNLQLVVKMTLTATPESIVIGSSDMTGTETIRVCGSLAQSVPVGLSHPVTGSVSNVAFAGTSSSVESLQGSTAQPADVKRTVAFVGTLRDGVISGTLTYNEEFASPPATTVGTTGSGSATFETTLR